MKRFIKNILGSCLGTILALCVIAAICAISISIYTGKGDVPGKGILHIPLDGLISEYNQGAINWESLEFNPGSTTLWDLRNKINAASKDKNIEGIFLEVKNATIPQEIAIQLVQVLESFKNSGKKVYAYSNYFDQNNYLAASIADSIFLNPNGGVDLRGYAVLSPFFSSLLERFKIDVNVFYAGKYKGSTEPFRLESFSEENKYQLKVYLDQLHSSLVDHVSKNRRIETTWVQKILEEYISYDAGYMVKNNIVDRMLYYDEMKDILERDYENSDLVPIHSYEVKTKTSKGEKLAIVFAEGEIVWGEGGIGTIGNDEYSDLFTKIRENEDIKAVLIRLNSPGGNGYTSDNLHREIKLLRNADKKVFASLGGTATSGAYYMAAACDSIFAEENTLTGSIGVYIMLPTFDRFLKEELDITFDSISTSSNAITYHPMFSISENEKDQLKKQTAKLYDQFVEKVAVGRDLSIDSVENLAQGRLWTGIDALEVGLIDELASFDHTIQHILEVENMDENNISVFPKRKLKFVERLIDNNVISLKDSEWLSFIENVGQKPELQSIVKKPLPQMQSPIRVFVKKW